MNQYPDSNYKEKIPFIRINHIFTQAPKWTERHRQMHSDHSGCNAGILHWPLRQQLLQWLSCRKGLFLWFGTHTEQKEKGFEFQVMNASLSQWKPTILIAWQLAGDGHARPARAQYSIVKLKKRHTEMWKRCPVWVQGGPEKLLWSYISPMPLLSSVVVKQAREKVLVHLWEPVLEGVV